jgi:hypothetical protein
MLLRSRFERRCADTPEETTLTAVRGEGKLKMLYTQTIVLFGLHDDWGLHRNLGRGRGRISDIEHFVKGRKVGRDLREEVVVQEGKRILARTLLRWATLDSKDVVERSLQAGQSHGGRGHIHVLLGRKGRDCRCG